MKMVNRLITITEGDITIDGTSVRALELTELRRGIGYVIQQIGLFPHMTVEDNIGDRSAAAGLGQGSASSARARELLELVGLDPDEHAKRYPSQLSGGQRQRVGLARAMAADPPLMLMDEPFGAIDPITRERLQNDFLRLHREIRKTVVFVTHDIDEAIKMGDRICILREGGVLAQYDTPEEILAAPGRRVRRPASSAPTAASSACRCAGSTRWICCRCRPGQPLDARVLVDDDAARRALADAHGGRAGVVVVGDGEARGTSRSR